MSDWNAQVIEEFRANAGKVGGFMEGRPLLLLHHTGAKTGTVRIAPLVYQDLGDALAVFASKGGAPDNPDWFHNLVANPDVVVEVGTETLEMTARVTSDDERDRIWARQKAEWDNFREYEDKTDRTIPVIVLEQR